MKITTHISFYYNSDRFCYINRIIQECNHYPFTTDIFIHTNNHFSNELLHEYTNGTIQIMVHDLSNIHPYMLTWKCRDLLKNQSNEYDIFMYIEDDILVPKDAILYWLKYNEVLVQHSYNLGFVRIETLDGEEYITDIPKNKNLHKLLKYDQIVSVTKSDRDSLSDTNELFVINEKYPYCAFWIYNKSEFHRFIHSEFYKLPNNIGNYGNYGIREHSAFGLHEIKANWYKHTIIPVVEHENNNASNIKYLLHPSCRIYHLPNNYVTNSSNDFATIKFSECIRNI